MKPEPGHIEEGLHVFPIRIYYEDTDAAGIVYFANYLKFAERARTEFLRQAGIDHTFLRREQDVVFAVHRAEVDYRRPARLDDVLTVHTQLTELTYAKVDALQSIRRGSEEIARVMTRVVCLKADGRPARMPKEIRDRFLPYVRPLAAAGAETRADSAGKQREGI